MREGDVTTYLTKEEESERCEDELRGLRNVGSLKKLGKSKKWILPWSLEKRTQPCYHLDLSPMRPVLGS